MATIDELVVNLALDPSDFVAKSKTARDDLAKTQEAGTKLAKTTQENFGKTAEASEKSSKLMEAGAKSVTAGFGALTEAALGAFAIFTSFKGAEAFIANTTRSDAAVGRLANNLGIASRVLGGWEGAVKAVGGSAGDLDAAMTAINQARANWEIKRNTGNDSIWNILGISPDDLKDAPGVLEKLSAAQQKLHLNNRDFSNLLGQLGIPQPVIDFLEKGPDYVKSHVAQFEKLAPTNQQTKEAQDRQTAFEKLDSTVTEIGRELLHDVNPALTAFLGVLQTIADWGVKHPNLFGAGAAAVATGAGGLSWLAIRKLLGLGGKGAVTAAEEAGVVAGGGAGAAAAAALTAAGILFVPSGDTNAGEQEELHKRGLAPRDGGRTVTSSAVDTTLPPVARGLLNTIATGESGGDYARSYGNSPDFASFADHPRVETQLANGSQTSAAGRYQFEAGTWDEAKKALGLTDFSPASQDKAAWWLAQRDYGKNTGRDLLTDLEAHDPKTDALIKSSLAKTWTSLGQKSDDAFASQLDSLSPSADSGMSFGGTPSAAPTNPKVPAANGGDLSPGVQSVLKSLTATPPAADAHPGMVFDHASKNWVPLATAAPGAGSGTTNHNDNSTTATTHVNGPITIHTAATDAPGIAKSLKSHLAGYAAVNQTALGLA